MLPIGLPSPVAMSYPPVIGKRLFGSSTSGSPGCVPVPSNVSLLASAVYGLAAVMSLKLAA